MDISVDTKKSVVQIDSLSQSLFELQKTLLVTSKATSTSAEALTGFGAMAVKTASAIQVLSFGFSTLLKPIFSTVKAYGAQEQSLLKLRASLSAVGQLTENHVNLFSEFADELSNVANVSEETALNLASMAKVTGLSDNQTKDLVKTSADLAVLMDKDINMAFRELLNLYTGMPNKVAKLIPEIEGLTRAQILSGKGVALVSEKLKGFAEKSAKSTLGALAGLTSDFENFAKVVGKSLSEDLLRLPEVFASLRVELRSLKESFEGATPRLRMLVEAFKSVDWGNVTTSILGLAGAFLALKTAIAGVALVQAVQAIGGLSAAMAAMGGMAGIVTQIVAFFGALKVAAIAALAPLAKVALIASAFLAVGASVDIILKNLHQLDALGKVVGLTLQLAFQKAAAAGQFFDNAVKSLGTDLARFINDFTGKKLINLTPIEANDQKRLEEAKKTFDQIEKTSRELADASKQINFGLAGEAAKFLSKALSDTAQKTKDAAKNTKDWADSTRGISAPVDEINKSIAEFANKNAELRADIEGIGASQVTQIQSVLDLELERLDIKEAQLAAEGKLNGVMGARLKEQIELQRELLEERADLQTAQAISPSSVSADQAEAIQRAFGAGAAAFASSIGSAMGGISAVTGAISAVMDAVTGLLSFVQKLIDFIPAVLDQLTKIFTTLTELPGKILESVKNLGSAAVKMVSDLIPNLFAAIPEVIDELVAAIFEKIPEAITALFDKLPEIFARFAERLPEVIQRLVQGLVAAAPEIAIRLTDGLIKAAPRIAIAMAKQFAIDIPIAIAKGIVDGIKRIFGLLKNFGKNMVDTKSITNALSAIGKRLTGEASKLFAVTDLTDTAQGATDAFKDLKNSITDAMQEALDMLKALWDELMRGLVAIWRFIYDTFIQPLIDGILFAWRWVYDNIIEPLVGVVQRAFQWVVDNIIAPLAGAVMAAWQWVIDKVINPIAGAISGAFQWVVDNVINPIKNLFSTLASWKFPKFPTFSFPEIKFSWPELPKWSWPALPELKITLPGGGGGGDSKAWYDPTGWSKGGLIPTYAANGMMIPKGTDTVPAMLTPGEFVVNRNAVNSLGASAMQAINKGQAPVQNTSVNVNLKIETTEPMDENYIRQRLMPRLREELRRASLDGGFVIAGSGIR